MNAPESGEEARSRRPAVTPELPYYAGYPEHDSVRGADGLGITVAFFRDLDSIRRRGYRVPICRVESACGFERPR